MNGFQTSLRHLGPVSQGDKMSLNSVKGELPGQPLALFREGGHSPEQPYISLSSGHSVVFSELWAQLA